MPLKNPKSIPKIPKARSKTISNLKEATPRKKVSETEYICEVYFCTDKTKTKQQYCIRLSTIRNFSMLNYEISVKHKKEKKSIDISLIGLNTRPSYIAKSGPAFCDVVYSKLYGKYTINIIKQDGSINSALMDFNVFKKQIIIEKEFLPEKKNNRKFCEFKVANESFTFSKNGDK